jgi:thiamine-phosphate pyrophosphorylase
VSSLEGVRLYLVTGSRIGSHPVVDVIPELVRAGVDMVQLREKEMEGGDLLREGHPLAEACREAGVPFVVNDRPDVALALESGVHLGQNDLPAAVARRILGGAIIGMSTHARGEIEAALGSETPIDYIAVGPVHQTPTKPGRPSVGLELVRYAAGVAEIPWFAIGGINRDNIHHVIDAGARRVVVVRAVTEASDPIAAAAELKSALEAAPPVIS